MKLREYNSLAYDFAMRNPRVIELLGMELTTNVIQELLTFGIDASSEVLENDIMIPIYSLQELNLNYKHLKHIKHIPHSPYGEGLFRDEKTFELQDNYLGNKILIQPIIANRIYIGQEFSEEAWLRIDELFNNSFESRGRGGGKKRRLVQGLLFKNYDAVTFLNETVFSLDPSTNTTKTINSDINLVAEWIHPDKYLQLLPKNQYLS